MLSRLQVSGHIYTEEGKKVLALSGAWNSHLDMQPCNEEGDPLPGSETTQLWQVQRRLLSSALRARERLLVSYLAPLHPAFVPSVIGRCDSHL